MFDRLTKDARDAVLTSASMAAERGAAKASPDHLLFAVAAANGAGTRILAGYGVTVAGLKAATARPSGRAGLTDDEISALRAVGIDTDEVFRRIEETFGPGALDESAMARRSRRRGWLGGPFDPQAKKVIELSLREAAALGHREISSAHILLALLRHGVSGPLGAVLADHGVTYDDARQRTLSELGGAA
jgi:ATP-dependent Clp protease ATP-binding subunit ClpA